AEGAAGREEGRGGQEVQLGVLGDQAEIRAGGAEHVSTAGDRGHGGPKPTARAEPPVLRGFRVHNGPPPGGQPERGPPPLSQQWSPLVAYPPFSPSSPACSRWAAPPRKPRPGGSRRRRRWPATCWSDSRATSRLRNSRRSSRVSTPSRRRAGRRSTA